MLLPQIPTGADLNYRAWQSIHGKWPIPKPSAIYQYAYQVFGDGMEEDAAGFRYLLNAFQRYLVASSCSKNFGLYRERTGLAVIASIHCNRANLH